MVDDTYGREGGKGRLVIKYLSGKGWKIVANAYQVIMVYEGPPGPPDF